MPFPNAKTKDETIANRLWEYTRKRGLVDRGQATILEERGLDKYNIPIIKISENDILPEPGR
jgi:hypothetical protein